jgi:hypothetical protein
LCLVGVLEPPSPVPVPLALEALLRIGSELRAEERREPRVGGDELVGGGPGDQELRGPAALAAVTDTGPVQIPIAVPVPLADVAPDSDGLTPLWLVPVLVVVGVAAVAGLVIVLMRRRR